MDCRLCLDTWRPMGCERADVQPATTAVVVDGDAWPVCSECADLIRDNERQRRADREDRADRDARRCTG